MKMSSVNFNTTISNLLLLVVAIILIITSYTIVQEKEIFFLDEVWTFFLSNYPAVTFQEIWDNLFAGSIQSLITNKSDMILTGVYTQKEFFDILSVPNGHGFNYFNTYCLQTIDVHPPLYYFIIHTLCVITHSQNLAMIGWMVNIVFLLITIFLLYRITILLTNNRWMTFAVICFYGFSYEFLDTVIFFRMYAMSACWITLILYYHLKAAVSGFSMSKNLLLKICAVEFLALYTQYFTSYCIVSVVAIYIYILFKKRLNWKKYLYFQAFTALFYLVIWPQCIYHILKGGTINSTYHIGGVVSLVLGYASLLKNSFFLGQWILLALFIVMTVALLGYSYKRNWTACKQWLFSDNSLPYLLVFAPALFYYLCVVIFTNLIEQRYIAPVMPIVSILLVLAIWRMLDVIFKKGKLIKWTNITLVVGIACISIFSTYTKATGKLTEYAHKKVFVEKHCKGPAIVWDTDDFPLFVDVLKNYPHSKYIHTVSKYSKTYLADKLECNDYTLYVNNFCDINEVLQYFEGQNFSYQESELEADFHKVYRLSKN